MDLANYVNECLIDNAHPGHPSGIGFFPLNAMTQDEVRYLVRAYILHVHLITNANTSADTFLKVNLDSMYEETLRCLELSNFLGAVWALYMLEPDIYGVDPDHTYHFRLAEARMRAQKLVKERFAC